MANLIIHIGTQKTGTSALQYFLSKNRKRLYELGVLYPLSGIWKKQIGHHYITQLIKEEKSRDLSKVYDDIVEESNDVDIVVLSSEAFQNVKNPHLLEPLISQFDQTIIICYFREALDFLASAYRQKVQAQDYGESLAYYIFRKHLNYSDLYNRWNQLSVNFIPRLYERETLKNSNLIDDFLWNVLQIESDNSFDTQIDRNYSIGGNLLVYKLIRNRLNLSNKARDYSIYNLLASQKETNRLKPWISEKDQSLFRSKNANNHFLVHHFDNFKIPDFSKNRKLLVNDEFVADINDFNEYFEIALDSLTAIDMAKKLI